MMINRWYILIIAATFLQACGLTPPQCPLNPDKPVIEYEGFNQQLDGSGTLTISFFDCDGDIGVGEADESSRNLILTYYELKNGTWVEITPMIPFEYRIPDLEPTGKHKYIEGDIEVVIEPYYYDFLSTFEAVKFDITLIDKAGNKSNTVTTDELIVP